jgi:hypothetical protein
MGKELSVIRRWLKESIDYDWYDRLFALQLFMSGDKDTIDRAQKGKVLARPISDKNSGELPNYTEILPLLGEVGTQNHGLVNARINVQGLTMEPELVFEHQDPIVRQVNQAFIRDRWVSQRWDEELFIGGLEVECNGMSGFHCGIDDGRVNWKHVPILDTLFDRSHKSPSQWAWVCVRDRLTPEECEQIYGSALTDDDVKTLTQDEKTQEGESSGSGTGRNVQPIRQIVEWTYYDKDDHVVFLGSINGATSIPLKLSKDGKYRKITGTTPTAGPNPYGLVPHAWWVDSWAPSVRRPVAKFETTMRLASFLNEVERYMVNTLREGVPITAIDLTAVSDPDTIEQIKKARSSHDLSRLLVMDGNVREALHRTDPAELPEICLHLRGILKEEINASTGVGDMQRGQALGGERKTRLEIQTLEDQSGVQARHFKRRFAHCVEDMVGVTRAIAAQFDTKRCLLNLDDFNAVDTASIPLRPFLVEYMPVHVVPDSIGFKTDDDRKQDALAEFTQLHIPYINLGVMDPLKSLTRILKKWGLKDPMGELAKVAQMAPPAPSGMGPGMPPGSPDQGPPGMPPPGPGGLPPNELPPVTQMGHQPLPQQIQSPPSLPN